MITRDSVEILFGPASPVEAQLFVRIPSLPGGGEYSLRGTVRGPQSKLARTLPASAELQDLGAGPTLLARATIAEPCFWSPTLPALYDLRVELEHNNSCLDSISCVVGLRTLGTVGSDLRFENRRWVLRGAVAAEAEDLSPWIEARLAYGVVDPTDRLCDQAAREGLVIVAFLDSRSPDFHDKLRVLARCPAVIAAAFADPKDALDASRLRAAAGNLLLGNACRGVAHTTRWSDMVFCEFTEPSELTPASGLAQPVIATRVLERELIPAKARQECDQLQRDLAHLDDFAGYVVILPSGLPSRRDWAIHQEGFDAD